MTKGWVNCTIGKFKAACQEWPSCACVLDGLHAQDQRNVPRGRTYVGSAQAVGIGSRPSAVDLGASGLNLPGCDVKVNKSVRPRRFIRGVPGEQSKQRLQGMKGMLRTRERMSRLPKTCCHMSWASVMAAAMLRRCVACFLTGQKKSRDKPEIDSSVVTSGTQYHGNAGSLHCVTALCRKRCIFISEEL